MDEQMEQQPLTRILLKFVTIKVNRGKLGEGLECQIIQIDLSNPDKEFYYCYSRTYNIGQYMKREEFTINDF